MGRQSLPQCRKNSRRLRRAVFRSGRRSCAAALADSLSPYRVLGRGYAMVYDSKGRLCSADVLATGDKLTLRGAAHTAECTVTSVEELNESTQKL